MKNAWLFMVLFVVVVASGVFYFITREKSTPDYMMDTEPTEDVMTEDYMMEETTDSTLEIPVETGMEEGIKRISVMLTEQNDSGETGTVELAESNGVVMVMVRMTGAPLTAQPAHIHSGSCPNPGPVVYPLTDVVNGSSSTELDTLLANLEAQMPLAINVHKSAAESSVYVACGNLSF